MGRWVVYSLSLNHDRCFSRWLPGLDPEERSRASRFVSPDHARRFVLRRWGLRSLLAEHLEIDPEEIGFVVNPYGKPALAPQHGRSDLAFSASHSGDLALIALRFGTEPFGIDLERMRPLDDADDLVARFFSAEERRRYESLAPADRPEAFWRGWTVKEAFVKALGRGLSFPLDRFDVALDPGAPAAITAVRGEARRDWVVRSLPLDDGYRGAAVGIALPEAGTVESLDMGSLPAPRRSAPCS